ncbi:DUF2382 domain-containing protein [Streptomyces fumanus]|uniref:Photosystem reaction center subunit H n=1 Tax=Streptomyces fumanus TaxID=67302 RepID=A0A919E7V8_9ACTN|nr:PRC and DUF2382 domain-containing protein [Streptomyces fumanus]GHF23243.1 photosystem reaction center subunit H [Streptomyces fumanus]
MITREQIRNLLDHPVYDGDGNKIGEASHVFFDDVTGRPEWVSVKTGMFGSKECFVPIRDASLVEDHLEVPYRKDQIKDAPSVDVDAGGHLSATEEHRLYDYYGINWDNVLTDAETPGDRSTDTGTGTTAAAGTAGTAGMAGAPGSGRRAGMTGMGAAGERGGTDRAGMRGDDAMTVSEERLRVGVERHESGRARLRKYVVTEEVEQTVPVRHEEVRVEREPITEANRGDALAGPEISEAEHEVTLHEERAVVETETVPVERVRLTTEEHVENETVRGQVRKERIETEGVEDDTGRTGRWPHK